MLLSNVGRATSIVMRLGVMKQIDVLCLNNYVITAISCFQGNSIDFANSQYILCVFLTKFFF